MRRKCLKALFSVIAVICVLYIFQRLLEPKYMDAIEEGAMIAEYYAEEKNHNVIIIGDCEVYENISPPVLWEEYGINSYIRGSAEQLIWQSYYLLEETLTYETPEAVVFNVLSMEFNEPRKEEYNRMTLDGMRWSSSKINSIKASMTDEESFIEYLFPILRYHSRWKELTAEDFKYLFYRDKVTHNGYHMQIGVKPAKNVPEGRPLADYGFGDNAWHYLDKMTELCREKGVELILIKAPSLYPYWYDEWEQQIEEYAKEHNLKYYNFLENIEEIGLDYDTDTYDAGLHLNLSGAEKLSKYFGRLLIEEAGVSSLKDDKELSESWEQKLDDYNREKKEKTEKLISSYKE